MHEQNFPKKKIAVRLLSWVMITALLVGAILGLTQVGLDALRAQDEFDADANQLLQVVKQPATQAVYSIDPELAEQVIEGLFKRTSIRYAAITHPDATVLAERNRPLTESSSRWLSDPLFQRERKYSIRLLKNDPDPVYYGDLVITIDTALGTGHFIERSGIVLLSGLIRAAILGAIIFFVCHFLLTRPIMMLINSIAQVDPSNPGEKQLRIPRGHKSDEIGTWVTTTNTLFSEISENQQKRRAAEARVLKLSQYDPLTGLPNRLMFTNHLENALEDARRLKQKVAVFCCGIDDFKSINEQHTYSTGDQLLQMYAERLTSSLDTPLIASRLGGDQFAMLIYNVGSAFKAAELVDSLIKGLNKGFVLSEHEEVRLHTTIGITIFPDDGEKPDKLLQKAEHTMTLAKTVSRNQYQFYVASVDSEMRKRKQLGRDLANAIEGNELYLVYQPQIDYQNNLITGVEALLRWTHPEQGNIPPDLFIPIAEGEGSIIQIGEWVIHQVCAQIANWRAQGNELNVSINLSANQLKQPDIEVTIQRALEKHNIPPSTIEIEVTETGFMENMEQATEKLDILKELGITISVDDFGTGYSSLSYLKRLPIDKIKIDKQFVRDLFVDDDDTIIVNAIIQLGKTLRLKVIAEGVETLEQETYLRKNGCEMGQGYFYSKPVLPSEVIKYIKSFNRE